jgi:hypothetical protein
MTMRDKISHIVWANRQTHNLDADYIADAIIKALPDMIPDLVWEDITAGWGTTDYFIMPVLSSGEFRVYGIKGNYDNSAQYPDLEAAQAAANTHHRAAVMAAFKGEET